MLNWLFRRKPTGEPPLLWLNDRDSIDLHSSYEGFYIGGATGSGKTSGPGDALARALLSRGAGFCVLCAKPDEFARWKRLCEQTGRTADLVRFAPGADVRCDLLNYELSHPEGTVEAASQLLDTLIEVSGRQSEGRGDEQFWSLLAQKIFRRAIGTVWYGQKKCSLSDVYALICSAPESMEQAEDRDWQARSYCAQCLLMAKERQHLLPYPRDLELCADFWLAEWPGLSEKTRSVGYSMTTNVLDKFLSGPVAGLVASGETNFTPKAIADEAKVCVIDMPYLRWRDPGRFLAILFKTLVQRDVLRRDVSQSPTPVVVWQDEGQLFVTKQDVEVQAVARQSRLISVFITQSLPVLYEALGGGPRAEQQAQALIGNLQTKVLCQQSDQTTNEYFSETFGHGRHLFMNGNTNSGAYDPVGDWLGMDQPQASAGFTEQWHADVTPEQFTRLRKGARENNMTVDCFIFQGGRQFSNGKTWIKTSFLQRT